MFPFTHCLEEHVANEQVDEAKDNQDHGDIHQQHDVVEQMEGEVAGQVGLLHVLDGLVNHLGVLLVDQIKMRTPGGRNDRPPPI